MKLKLQLPLFTSVCAESSLRECTSKRMGWNSRSLAGGLEPGFCPRHLWMKSFCNGSSRLSMVLLIWSSVTKVPESPLPWISSAAISRAHIPNEYMSMAGLTVAEKPDTQTIGMLQFHLTSSQHKKLLKEQTVKINK